VTDESPNVEIISPRLEVNTECKAPEAPDVLPEAAENLDSLTVEAPRSPENVVSDPE